MTEVIGILGAGKVGTAIARRALAAGYRVRIAGSGDPQNIALVLQFVAPGAVAGTAREVVEGSDIVILALPLSRYRDLPPDCFAGRITVDAMNYWPPTEGHLPEFEGERSSTEVLGDYLRGARLVRSFNHMGYHEIDEQARPAGDPGRRALAVAGEDGEARRIVADFIDRIGFDPVDAGGIKAARAFAIGTPVFGAPLDRAALTAAIAAECGAQSNQGDSE